MFTIHRGNQVTTLVDAQGRIRYAIESMFVDGWWCSSVRSVAQSRSETGDAPDFWYDEVAKVEWRSQGTVVAFGHRKVNANSYLRKDQRSPNNRVFTGPDDELFRWKLNLKGDGLSLHDESSGALVACSRAARQGVDLFFLSIKPRVDSLVVNMEHSKVPQMLDKIVITWVIIDGMMHNQELNWQRSYS